MSWLGMGKEWEGGEERMGRGRHFCNSISGRMGGEEKIKLAA